ncbi:MAG: glutamate synthase large subunit [Rhodothermales bacterium]
MKLSSFRDRNRLSADGFPSNLSTDGLSNGLYSAEHEHDACGVGFICSIYNNRSHDIVQSGLRILENLDHRGATGADPDTGDGAGILTHIPHLFFASVVEGISISLPEAGSYGVGMAFLSKDKQEFSRQEAIIERVVEEENLRFLGWRSVPVKSDAIGVTARESEPAIRQFFVGLGNEALETVDFERRLYLVRKLIENQVSKSAHPDHGFFYLPSLSSQTIIYKGMLTTHQLGIYFEDLNDPLFDSAIAMVHSRFSTNTFPEWSLAQPFRRMSHNGEINTLRGNINWMKSRQALFNAPKFGGDISRLYPLLDDGASDSQVFDNALELMCHSGRSLPHAMMMMIPEAWEHDTLMDADKKAFYSYHSCLMEPWDGPATVPFTDGRYIGAVLDRNGLRPSRFSVTKDGIVVLASEAGVLDIDPATIIRKGRLQPGKMFLIDLKEKRIIEDEEIKATISRKEPYAQWLSDNLIYLQDLPKGKNNVPVRENEALRTDLHLFGYTREDREILMPPMMFNGKEGLGSMGDDTPLAVLSERPRLLYDYFKQLFAQVTNPPLDAIREEIVTSLYTNLGAQQNLLAAGSESCRLLRLEHPVLSNEALASIRGSKIETLNTATIPILFDGSKGGEGLKRGLEQLFAAASEKIEQGHTVLILSDRDWSAEQLPMPALLATAALQHHLINTGQRFNASIVVESGEPREVHHFCTLIGYGADAINPYLAFEFANEVIEAAGSEIDLYTARKNYIKAVGKGILKVMSKMGISTVQSYQGAQIFEAIGVGKEVIDNYFTNTPSRIGGINLDVIAEEVNLRYDYARKKGASEYQDLDAGGRYQWRRDGEHHHLNPLSVAKIQQAVRDNDPKTYDDFSRIVNAESKERGTLRGLLEFSDEVTPVPLDEVEPWTEIVKRFKTGAMSYGSISQETHETLAVAMNQLGGRSNTGEGGEDPERYAKSSPKRSRIKQVASGRFGVTISYLASADEIQIKMAQGAKPGEGGQLPGEKVYPWIAKTRHSTPYVGLISPPPHHDIYSIEDLAQLIYDLKNANPEARITVKLVSEVGVGTIAAGVAKGKADVILISGNDGGTGASPQTSLMHAGIPWELGLSETHQTLTLNGLRNRVRVECDGQLKTGRDVAVACLLGAEEFGFATVPLIAMGCIMMRKCHLNTCPVGIATQDPELRKKFQGQPEHVVNYFHFIAEELRQYMAQLGIRSIDEMKGRVDLLKAAPQENRWKAKYLDLSPILKKVEVPAELVPFNSYAQDHGLEDVKDQWLIKQADLTLETGAPVTIKTPICNADRTFGTMLSNRIVGKFGNKGLPDETIRIECKGSAGQSFGAFGVKGLWMDLEGDANDYLGKGLSGAKLIVRPPANAGYVAEDNIIIGNVALYGATSGSAFIRGKAGERFCVRNSGVTAVVEGVGDHACEYMTGGNVVVLGLTGRNFAAGMSGGVAYVFDEAGTFAEERCNREMVDLEKVDVAHEIDYLKELITTHLELTGSQVAVRILENWDAALKQFTKVIPVEYKKALKKLEEQARKSIVTSSVAA